MTTDPVDADPADGLSKSPKVPNVVLRRIRVEERQETRKELAVALRRLAVRMGESISPSERYVARLLL